MFRSQSALSKRSQALSFSGLLFWASSLDVVRQRSALRPHENFCRGLARACACARPRRRGTALSRRGSSHAAAATEEATGSRARYGSIAQPQLVKLHRRQVPEYMSTRTAVRSSLRALQQTNSGKIQSYNPSKMATAPAAPSPDRRLEGSADLSASVATASLLLLARKRGFSPVYIEPSLCVFVRARALRDAFDAGGH